MVTLAEATVMMPLHRSWPFREVVAANIDRLGGHAHLIVSDADEGDDTLAWLRSRFGELPGVTWLGRRSLPSGWVQHCNDLASHACTPTLMWLPHDDEVDLAYLVACLEALADRPALGAVVGQVASVDGPGLIARDQPAFPTPDRLARFGEPANALLAEWNLGLLFRALTRREAWRPLPSTIDGDEWADMVWAYGLTLDWPVLELDDIVYRKRYHSASAHAAWTTEFYPRGLPYLMRELAVRVPPERLGSAAIELVDVVTTWTADVVDERSRRAALLEERLDSVTRPMSMRILDRLRRGTGSSATC